MTKKHFVALAKHLAKDIATGYLSGNDYPYDAVICIAEFYKSINPRFNEARFYEAVDAEIERIERETGVKVEL